MPSVQLVVAGKRYTLLEATMRVCSPTDGIALKLQAECHIEVFRHIRFRPEPFLAVSWVNECGFLQGGPSEEPGGASVAIELVTEIPLTRYVRQTVQRHH